MAFLASFSASVSLFFFFLLVIPFQDNVISFSPIFPHPPTPPQTHTQAFFFLGGHLFLIAIYDKELEILSYVGIF